MTFNATISGDLSLRISPDPSIFGESVIKIDTAGRAEPSFILDSSTSGIVYTGTQAKLEFSAGIANFRMGAFGIAGEWVINHGSQADMIYNTSDKHDFVSSAGGLIIPNLPTATISSMIKREGEMVFDDDLKVFQFWNGTAFVSLSSPISGTGTAGAIAKFSTASTLANSIMSEAGEVITLIGVSPSFFLDSTGTGNLGLTLSGGTAFITNSEGSITIAQSSATNLSLGASTGTKTFINQSPFQLGLLTTAQKSALTPENGWMIFDTDLGAFQLYDGSWNDPLSGGGVSPGTAEFVTKYDATGNNIENSVMVQGAAPSATSLTGFGVNTTTVKAAMHIVVGTPGVYSPNNDTAFIVESSGTNYQSMLSGVGINIITFGSPAIPGDFFLVNQVGSSTRLGPAAGGGFQIENDPDADPCSFLSEAGALLTPITTVTRDALTPGKGQQIMNDTTGQMEFYDGSSWVPMGSGAGGVSGSGTINFVPLWNGATSLTDSALSIIGQTFLYSNNNPVFQMNSTDESTNFSITVEPEVTIASNTEIIVNSTGYLSLSATGFAVNVGSGTALQLGLFTDVSRDAFVPVNNGQMIYNNTVTELQTYLGGGWQKIYSGALGTTVITGSGTANRLPVFTSANIIADSGLAYLADSFTMTDNEPVLTINATSTGVSADFEVINDLTITSSTSVQIFSTGATSQITLGSPRRVVIGQITDLCTVQLSSITTAERDALSSVVNGEIFYNETTNTVQARENGVWVSLSSGGGITGSGTTNALMKWTSSSTAGDSSISDTGAVLLATLPFRPQITSSDPGITTFGAIYYNSTDNKLKYYEGGGPGWTTIGNLFGTGTTNALARWNSGALENSSISESTNLVEVTAVSSKGFRPGYVSDAAIAGWTPDNGWMVQNFTTGYLQVYSPFNSGEWTEVAVGQKGSGGGLQMQGVTTGARDALTARAGMIIFNTTTSKHQGYDGSTWNDLY